VYRCQECKGIYYVKSGTVLEGRHFHREQAVLSIRGMCHVLSPVCQRVAKELAAMLYVPEVMFSRVAPGARAGNEKHARRHAVSLG